MEAEGLASTAHEKTYADSVQAMLLRQNRWINWKSIHTVEHNGTEVQVDGRITEIGLYNTLLSGLYIQPFLLPFDLSISGPYAYQRHRYEVTWNANNTLVDDGWVLQNTVDKMIVAQGLPWQVSTVGWGSPTIFNFSPLGPPTKEDYVSYKKEWKYHSDTDLLSKTIGIDGTNATFTRDLFDGPDLISSSFPHLASSNYAANNPINNIDYQELAPVKANGGPGYPYAHQQFKARVEGIARSISD